MQLSRLFATAITILGVQAKLQSKEDYLKNIAPSELDRLSKYEASHKDLNLSQKAALNLIKSAVTNFATDEQDSIEKVCNAAFGEAECKNILFGGQPSASTSNTRRSGLKKRVGSCTCTVSSDYCGNGLVCKNLPGECAPAGANGRKFPPVRGFALT